ncbi:MAG: hypothetical protein WCT00_06195 [Bacilli bacterium]
MEKQLMISMKPEYALAILQRKKTLELRKWIPKDFKGWVSVYITKAEPYLIHLSNYFGECIETVINGNVMFRFWFENYDEINTLNKEEVLKKSCVSEEVLKKYEKGYAWHIDKIKVFNLPKTLEEFNIKKAPQKCAYVYVNKEE